ncbi:MAG: hypothetical protein L3J44_02295 [Campylobacteraceae bacterium]|nr:hypothetical protein [Campylobacteraceae bacterium]
MIALMVMGAFLVYILISLLVIWVVYKKYKTKKALFIALLVMILIPTWDVIIGKPIYNYLCKNKAGVHIYKTVDNVEGFYIGEQSKQWEPYEPYKGYKYVDYKEQESGKYYRSYWVDNNTSKDCVPIGDDEWSKDGKLYSWWFHHGKCIVKKEIPENDVSRWEFDNDWIDRSILPGIDLKIVSSARVIKRADKTVASELIRIVWKGGWVYGIISSIPVGNSWKIKCPTIHDVPGRTIILKTLKIKKEK